MKKCILLLTLVLVGSASGAEKLNVKDTPIGPPWWPSEWGPEDQRGAANRMTPESIAKAAQLIRKGEMVQLGRLYEFGMPLPGKRHFSLIIPGSPTGGPEGENMIVHHDEVFSGQIGQIGTQFDGLGHVGVRIGNEDVFYNGFRRSEFGKTYGLEKLGVENAGSFFTRGVLIDVAAYKGVERLEPEQVISAEDLQGALKKQNVSLRPGDTVLINTGHGKLWMKDNKLFGDTEPGIGMGAARWLVSQKVVLVGCDNWAVEAVPGEDPKRGFEVHQLMLVRHGIYFLENLDLSELSARKVYEFAFIYTPLRLKGASGSPGNPLAIW